eukprot:TRINITY_DN12593_c0_g1_i2.p1 TRINITY_DN12593_c0_g1~~TRINITY_DN12593_c0_g1_i2.p1  ORF type:complete len:441 (+),score=110.59 TRINITY_DN12593_c0_g1_i2:180-1325(+)
MGLDAGGLTSAFFECLSASIIGPRGSFAIVSSENEADDEKKDVDENMVARQREYDELQRAALFEVYDQRDSDLVFVMPKKSDSISALEQFEACGVFFAQAILQGRPLFASQYLCDLIWRTLLNPALTTRLILVLGPQNASTTRQTLVQLLNLAEEAILEILPAVTWRDYEQYVGAALANQQASMLCYSAEQMRELGVSFEGLKVGGEQIAVTYQNREEWLAMKLKASMLQGRAKALVALALGFASVKAVWQEVSSLSVAAVRRLVVGEVTVTAQQVLSLIKIYDFGAQSSTPRHLQRAIQQATPLQLRQFLLFVTGLFSVPLWASNGYIKVLRAGHLDAQCLPVAHPFSRHLDVPDYGQAEVLTTKLWQAVTEGLSEMSLL